MVISNKLNKYINCYNNLYNIYIFNDTNFLFALFYLLILKIHSRPCMMITSCSPFLPKKYKINYLASEKI